jgi:hypothetical protein
MQGANSTSGINVPPGAQIEMYVVFVTVIVTIFIVTI